MTYLAVLRQRLQSAIDVLDEYAATRDNPVTAEELAEDVIDSCEREGWDCTLLFWDEGRYNDDGNEVPSEAAINVARRLLENYEMKPRL